MAEEKTPAAGANAGIDVEQLRADLRADIMKEFAPIVGKAISDAQKPVLDQLAKLQQPATEQQQPQGDGKGKPITLEDVGKLLDSKLSQQQQNARQADERKNFIGGNLKDLPAAYQNQLGSDPTKWPEEEQTIRNQFKSDFKAAGGKTPPVGGDNPGGKPPEKVIDISKMSPTQKLEVGIKQEAAARATSNANV